MDKRSNHKPNSLRIIGGELRRRKLEFPSVEGLRPTADRLRETLFNWLQDSVAGANCLDLFAGSGALGFEALSRGAAHVDFIEKEHRAVEAINESLARLEVKQGAVSCADALDWIDRMRSDARQYEIVFLDPPFSEKLLDEVAAKLESSGLLSKNCLVYVEREKNSELNLPANWLEIKAKNAGSVSFALYEVTRSN